MTLDSKKRRRSRKDMESIENPWQPLATKSMFPSINGQIIYIRVPIPRKIKPTPRTKDDTFSYLLNISKALWGMATSQGGVYHSMHIACQPSWPVASWRAVLAGNGRHSWYSARCQRYGSRLRNASALVTTEESWLIAHSNLYPPTHYRTT